MIDTSAMDCILAPSSVVIVGASDDVSRIGGRAIASMKRGGYTGEILPVNPSRGQVQGLHCYPDVRALPQAPDAALIGIAAAGVPEALDALGQKECKAVTLFSAGFSETGPEGAKAQEHILEIAARYGMRLLGPNTLGVYNTEIGYFGTFSSAFDSAMPTPGNIGIASQSGAFGAHLGVLARARSLGTSVFLATGNEADLTVADAIAWMARHKGTDVICCYLEAVNDGPGMLEALDLAAAARKPVIVLKSGSSQTGAEAAASHTASLAGDFAIAKAVLEDHGAILVEDLDTMMDFAYVASKGVFPPQRSLGVVTVSGGAGIVACDEAERLGLPLPPMPQAAQDRLKRRLPFASPVNPLDCTAQAVNDPALFEEFAASALEDGGYGAILCFLTYVAGSPHLADGLVATLKGLRKRYPDRLIAVCAIGHETILARYDDAGICVFSEPVRAVRALDAACRLGESFPGERTSTPVIEMEPVRLPARTPNEDDARRLLEEAGIPFPQQGVANNADEAAELASLIGFPVVMKILSPDIQHKSDIGGVRLGIGSREEAREAYVAIRAAAYDKAPGARIDGVLVARQVSGRTEVYMGIKQDPAFGPIAAFGLGGVFVEILDDVVLRRCPFDADAAKEMIGSIRAAPILLGARGRPPADIDALAGILSWLSHFAMAAGPRLASIDLNPVVVMENGQGAVALDAVITIGAGDEHPEKQVLQ